MARTAVVLLNLGGPDSLDAVRPFLRNLFSDPAILRVPGPLRWLLAQFFSHRRAPVARKIYAQLGGASPLLAGTEAQAKALAEALADLGEVRVEVAMRYWHPMSEEAARGLAEWRPHRVVLLPLYPQFSTTTTASSLLAWRRAARALGLEVPMHVVCCYPVLEALVAAQAELIGPILAESLEGGPTRLLFSAHGLPEKVVASGDPYQWQVEQTADAVARRLAVPELDWRVCYQSRIGPLSWIGPSTEDEITRAGAEGRSLVVVPIAFVSEHSETLVELDVEYADLAAAVEVPLYRRVPALATHPRFIEGLARLVRMALVRTSGRPAGAEGARLCPSAFAACAMADTEP